MSEVNTKELKVLVVGATGGSGLAAVNKLLEQGHIVTAFARGVDKMSLESSNLIKMCGDVMIQEDIEKATQGQDAVMIILGIQENPLQVRLLGSKKTPMCVRSEGTHNIIKAMQKHGVSRLLVQSSYGVGETRDLLGWIDRLFFTILLSPQIQDTERQELLVRESGLDWVLVQPVHLTDQDTDETSPYISLEGETRHMKVSRKQVGIALTTVLADSTISQRTVSISG